MYRGYNPRSPPPLRAIADWATDRNWGRALMKCQMVVRSLLSRLGPPGYSRGILSSLLGRHRARNPSNSQRWTMGPLVALCVLMRGVASAAPPPNMMPDSKMHAWFESLEQPGTQQRCCSISDCRFTSYEERDGHYEVNVDGWKYAVPDENVLHMTTNPTGRAVVCYAYTSFGASIPNGEVRTAPQDAIEILCFLPLQQIS
jgi:hypothetical protein